MDMGELRQFNAKAFKKGTWVKCYNPTCMYEWEYRGSMQYGCCPSCRHNVKVDFGNQFFVLYNIQNKNNNLAGDQPTQVITVASHTSEAGGDIS